MNDRDTIKWLRANLGKGCTAPLTSTDTKALAASVAIIELYAYDRHDSLLDAFGAVVNRMQESTRHLAYHAIASVMDWDDRAKVWRAAGLAIGEFGRCQYEHTANLI